MSDKEKMHYRVHMRNGEVWYCHQFGYIRDVSPEFTGNWVDPDADYGMAEAVLESFINTSREPSRLVLCPSGVDSVEILPEPRLTGYYTSMQTRLENFA